MSTIKVTTTTHKLVLDPAQGSVSVVQAGPQGPRGIGSGGVGPGVLDENDMVTNSHTIPPSQASVIAYITTKIAEALVDGGIVLNENDMASMSEEVPPSQASVVAYIAAQLADYVTSVLDEDDMASMSEDTPPSQASVVAYIDTLLATSDFLRGVNNLIDIPDPAAARENLGIGTLATLNGMLHYITVTFPTTVVQGDTVWGFDAAFDGYLLRVDVSTLNAPTNQAIIVDVNKNGTTVFTTQSNRPQVAINTKRDESGAPNSTQAPFVKGNRFELQLDQKHASDTPGRIIATFVVSELVV